MSSRSVVQFEEDAEEEPVTETSQLRQLKKKFTLNKDLIPLKLAIFLFYGADSLFLPYLTLQMVQAGFDMEEVAVVYAVLPFVTFVFPPIAGLLADKFNRYKLFLIGLVALSATFHTLLLHVDARVLPDDSGFLTEISCTPWGATVHFSDPNISRGSNDSFCDRREEWSGRLIPSECWPVSCQSDQPTRMEQCSLDDGNCSSVALDSQKEVGLSFQFLETDEEDVGNCTALTVTGSKTSNSSTLICNCLIKCPLKLQPSSSPNATISNQKEADRLRHQRGFWIYFMLRILASATLAAAFSMLDATAICMVKKCEADLGKQRLFGVIGQAAFGMIGGILLEWTVTTGGFPDYSLLFYIADGLFFLGILLVSRLDVDVERVETGDLMGSLGKLVRLIDVDVFLLMMLFLGTCWGFLESFIFVFLMELNASSMLLGTTVFMGCAVGVPFLYISDMVVRKLGSINVIATAFILYSIRFLGLSLIWEPWLCLIFEPVEGVTVHMMAVASSMYCASAAPPGLLATLNGAVGSVHYSFGRGVGGFAGGILISKCGMRTTFRIFAGIALTCGIIYFIAQRFYLAEMEKMRLRRKSERIASIVASGGEPEEEEPDEKFIIPPDIMLARRMSCF